MANLLAEWLILAGVCVTDVQAMVENHLKDMILRTFDPKKADTIFTEEGEVKLRTKQNIKHFYTIMFFFNWFYCDCEYIDYVTNNYFRHLPGSLR